MRTKPIRVYLCARVAYDARPFNSEVAAKLRQAGYEVYMPQDQAPNNLTQEDIEEGRYDVKTIFRMDYNALSRADVVVAVGRMGSDCSFEVGWAFARNVPIIHVPGTDTSYLKSPMLIPALTQYRTADVSNVAERVMIATYVYEETS